MIQCMKHSCVNAAPACHRKKTQNLTLLIPLESVIYFTEFVFAFNFFWCNCQENDNSFFMDV